MTIKSRLFLVGCPRSGTTLLQSLIATHPEIITFPESHFFHHLHHHRNLLLRRLDWASPNIRHHVNDFLCHVSQQGQAPNQPRKLAELPQFSLSKRRYTEAFIRLLDRLALQAKKSAWLEKTPEHVRHINTIEAFVERPLFIHLVRDGEAVVASLYDAALKYPNTWGAFEDIDEAINMWTKSIRCSHAHLHKENHLLVRYETLAEQPAIALKDICQFIGLSFHPQMIENYGKASQNIVMGHETWKQNVGNSIRNTNNQKFTQLFNPDQQAYILKRVSKMSMRLDTRLCSVD